MISLIILIIINNDNGLISLAYNKSSYIFKGLHSSLKLISTCKNE